MSLNDPFGYLKHKLWPKEGLKVKLPIWLPTTKSQKCPLFTCVKVECYISLKRSWSGLQLCFRLHLNRTSTKKVMGLQSRRSPHSMTKWHLGVGTMAKHKEYHKGEGGGFPQVRAVVSLVNPCLLVAHPCTKNAPSMH
jgi:hypothetical protein